MSDDLHGGVDDVSKIEALLGELRPEDLQGLDLRPPPSDVWTNIEAAVANEPAPPIALHSHRRTRRRWQIPAAAAAVVLIALGGVITFWNRGDSDEVLSRAILSHDPATMDPLGADASATAQLVERDGHFEIKLTDADLPSLAGDELELWMIEPDAAGNLVDIAPVAMVRSSDPGTYRVPDGLDPASHFIVDISIEPRDGDAAHSGRSILRGPLEQV
jgi:hypothetical protein